MAEDSPTTTPETTPEQPGGPAPAAPVQPEAKGAVTGDDETVTISKSEFEKMQKSNKDLLSQRDRNHESARATEAQVAQMAQEKDVEKWLKDPEQQKKFPDVNIDDLMEYPLDPEQYEKVAAQTQARIDSAVNRRIASIEKASEPSISPKDKAAKLKQLRENPGSGSFQQMLQLEQTPTSS